MLGLFFLDLPTGADVVLMHHVEGCSDVAPLDVAMTRFVSNYGDPC